MDAWIVRGGRSTADATGGLGFVCFIVVNPRVLTANRFDLGFFLVHKCLTPHTIFPHPPAPVTARVPYQLQSEPPLLGSFLPDGGGGDKIEPNFDKATSSPKISYA